MSTEDALFGESRLDKSTSTCRQRMADRDEKALHFSFAVVAYGSVLQAVLSSLAALLWWGSSKQSAQTTNAVVVAMIAIVMASFAVTIGCALRPVIRATFVFYAIWQIATGVIALSVMLDISNSNTAACKLAVENSTVPISTFAACPQLIQDLRTAVVARSQCESTFANGLCFWTDVCTARSPEQCEKTGAPDVCIYRSDIDQCRVDSRSDANIGHVHGVCAATGQCRFATHVWLAGVVYLFLTGLSVIAVVYILHNSKYPLKIALTTRRNQRSDDRSRLFFIGLHFA